MTDPAYSCARDYQLFGPGPKRILSLDGGGVRGSITVAFLERIEALLSAHGGRPVRLGDHFHLVGGTSTGAIIAGSLALGFRGEQVRKLYTELAPLAFKRHEMEPADPAAEIRRPRLAGTDREVSSATWSCRATS